MICGATEPIERFAACSQFMQHYIDRCVNCCGNISDETQCKCSEIMDRDSFRRCQNKNYNAFG